MGFILRKQGSDFKWFNIWNLISVIHHKNRLKKKKLTITTIDIEEALDKV